MTRRTMKVIAKQIEVQTRQIRKAQDELDKMVAESQKQVADEIDRVWNEREAQEQDDVQ